MGDTIRDLEVALTCLHITRSIRERPAPTAVFFDRANEASKLVAAHSAAYALCRENVLYRFDRAVACHEAFWRVWFRAALLLGLRLPSSERRCERAQRGGLSLLERFPGCADCWRLASAARPDKRDPELWGDRRGVVLFEAQTGSAIKRGGECAERAHRHRGRIAAHGAHTAQRERRKRGRQRVKSKGKRSKRVPCIINRFTLIGSRPIMLWRLGRPRR